MYVEDAMGRYCKVVSGRRLVKEICSLTLYVIKVFCSCVGKVGCVSLVFLKFFEVRKERSPGCLSEGR